MPRENEPGIEEVIKMGIVVDKNPALPPAYESLTIVYKNKVIKVLQNKNGEQVGYPTIIEDPDVIQRSLEEANRLEHANGK